MRNWLIQPDTLRELMARRQALPEPAAEQRAAYEARVSAARDDGPQCLTIAGNVAELSVDGVLVARKSFWLWLLGYDQTTYADLQAGISEIRGRADIRDVTVSVSSPGGDVNGLFDTLAAFEALRAEKSVRVHAHGAFSAAYGIAAVAGPIEAHHASSSFGSVGVAASYYLDDEVVDITNTESPDKRPDVSTEEGRAVVQRYLDALFEVFAEAIAKGRTTTVENVTKNFGRGASLIARDALERGMIDSVAGPQLRSVGGPGAASAHGLTSVAPLPSTSATAVPPQLSADTRSNPAAPPQTPTASAMRGAGEEATMPEDLTLRSLRADHPELYEQVVGIGAQQERDRVCAHLELGEQCGAMDIALGAVRAGDDMTQTLTAKYIGAAANRGAQTARQTDDDVVADVADGAEPQEPTDGPNLSAQVVDILEARRGKKVS